MAVNIVDRPFGNGSNADYCNTGVVEKLFTKRVPLLYDMRLLQFELVRQLNHLVFLAALADRNSDYSNKEKVIN